MALSPVFIRFAPIFLSLADSLFITLPVLFQFPQATLLLVQLLTVAVALQKGPFQRRRADIAVACAPPTFLETPIRGAIRPDAIIPARLVGLAIRANPVLGARLAMLRQTIR